MKAGRGHVTIRLRRRRVGRAMRVLRSPLLAAAFVLATATDARAETDRHGVIVAGYGGLNESHPFVGAQAGYRFARARFLEIYVDYAYSAAISEFSFQTFALGVRTYFLERGRFELYHQALAGFAVSSGGTTEVPDRSFGERFLGGFFNQGVGASVDVWRGLGVRLSVSTGYPVWLRSDLGVHYRF